VSASALPVGRERDQPLLLIMAARGTRPLTPLKSAFSTDLSKILESSEILEKYVAKTKEEDSQGESGGKTSFSLSPFVPSSFHCFKT
jgi:hypothetical protein